MCLYSIDIFSTTVPPLHKHGRAYNLGVCSPVSPFFFYGLQCRGLLLPLLNLYLSVLPAHLFYLKLFIYLGCSYK